MVDVAPVKDIEAMLRDNYDGSQVPALSSDPEFSTGKWGTEHKFPAVVVHSEDEGVLNGGETGITAYDGSGVGMQIRSGTVTVEAVAGRRSDLAENPKKVRSQLKGHLLSVLFDDANWPSGYRYIIPEATTDMEITTDEEDPGPIYSKQLTVAYQYHFS